MENHPAWLNLYGYEPGLDVIEPRTLDESNQNSSPALAFINISTDFEPPPGDGWEISKLRPGKSLARLYKDAYGRIMDKDVARVIISADDSLYGLGSAEVRHNGRPVAVVGVTPRYDATVISMLAVHHHYRRRNMLQSLVGLWSWYVSTRFPTEVNSRNVIAQVSLKLACHLAKLGIATEIRPFTYNLNKS